MNPSIFLLPIAIAILASGCLPIRTQSFTGPNEQSAYTLQCSGFGRDMADCEKKAAKLCPAGYSTLVQNADTVTGITPKTLTIECYPEIE